MKKLIIVGICGFQTLFCFSQLNLNFVHQYSSPVPSVTWSIDNDNLGNVYSVGRFQESVDLDPTNGVNIGLGNTAFSMNYDLYVTKTSPLGVVLWSFVLGADKMDYVSDIVVSNSGDVYITGRFSGIMDFDPSASSFIVSSTDQYDAYVLKFNTAGVFQWVEIFSGAGSVVPNAITIDSNNDVIIVGGFDGTCENGIILSSSGSSDGWISKVSSSGGVVYLRKIGGPSNDKILTVESYGLEVYIGGIFSNTCNISTNGVNNVTSAGGFDGFIARLNSLGNTIWSSSYGGTGGDEEVNAIAVFSNGDFVVGGRFYGTVDFDPAAGISNASVVGVADCYVSKFDQSGAFLWNVTFGGSSTENVTALAVTSSNRVFIGGWFNQVVDFDSGAGISLLNSTSGNIDSFVLELNSLGSFVNVSHLVASSDIIIRALEVGTSSVFICGEIGGSADFDFSVSTSIISNAIYTGNGFVACYNF